MYWYSAIVSITLVILFRLAIFYLAWNILWYLTSTWFLLYVWIFSNSYISAKTVMGFSINSGKSLRFFRLLLFYFFHFRTNAKRKTWFRNLVKYSLPILQSNLYLRFCWNLAFLGRFHLCSSFFSLILDWFRFCSILFRLFWDSLGLSTFYFILFLTYLRFLSDCLVILEQLDVFNRHRFWVGSDFFFAKINCGIESSSLARLLHHIFFLFFVLLLHLFTFKWK